MKHFLSEHGNALLKEVIQNEIGIRRKISWTSTVVKYSEEIMLKVAEINEISSLDNWYGSCRMEHTNVERRYIRKIHSC